MGLLDNSVTKEDAMRQRQLALNGFAVLFAIGSLLAAPAVAPRLSGQVLAQQQDQLLTEEDVISGTMEIEFNTRTKQDTSGDLVENSPAIGATDNYRFALAVAKTTEFEGNITRQPNLYSKTLRRLKQGASLGFNVNLSVRNPKDLKQKRTVGKMVGGVPVDEKSGAYILDAAGYKDVNPLRVVVDTVGAQQGFEDKFGGRIFGKAEKKDNLAGYTYKRLVGNKTVEVKVQRVDPMRFENVQLAKGPSTAYPRTTVNGRLDYDYETGNWLTDGIKFRYNMNGQDVEDVITGTIKWVEDANRASNGKGHYEFNLRFNEEKNRPAKTEAAAFENLSSEEAFFAVDEDLPALTGRIEYVDTFISGGTTPSASKVTYHLKANKLSRQQVMNFAKLWMLCVSPTNDE
jgi:hypothetical protein